MQKEREAKLLELFRAATEAQKQMVLGTLQSCVNRKNTTNNQEMFAIIGYSQGCKKPL